jgi:lysophospholipase L1-like esterase
MRTRSILSCLLLSASTGFLLAGNDTDYTYLALGDSVAFGFNPTLFGPPPTPLPTPAQFTGYPEVVAQVEHLLKSKKEVNAACPGETSGSFINTMAPDNGCNGLGPQGQPPFKASIGLHTNYTGSQLAFALSQLSSNKHIDLVTLGIGGNDLLLVEEFCIAHSTDPLSFKACVTSPGMLGTPQAPGVVIQSYAANLTYILTAIRQHYSGNLVLVNNYSPSADPLFIQAVAFLDGVAAQVGASFGVKIADAFTAFQIASATHGGDPCTAGLLIHLSQTSCDVHPSPLGRDLIAGTVIFAAGGKDGNSSVETEP